MVSSNGVMNLSWKTATEKNSDKFVVERVLADNKNVVNTWQSVGSVKAANLSNSPKEYSFVDKNVKPGKYQYRLKMIDNDGTFGYSNVIEAEVTIPKNFNLAQNYPNPFNPSTKINYQLPVDSRVTLELFDITGKRVAELVNEEQSTGFGPFCS